jgi:phosphatidylglycerol:prolipoprotein diacylglycerol transferase
MSLLAFIDPVAFRVGPIPVHWYGIIFVVAILAAVQIAGMGAKLRGLDPDFLPDLGVVIVVSGIVGARLYEVFILQYSNLHFYLTHPLEIIATWKGGLAIHGGVIGALLAGGIYVWRKKQPFWLWADVIGPGLILAQGIGRWGNFMNQEAYGSAAPQWLIEKMPGWLREGMTIEGTVMHPTFLYESLWNILCFALLYWIGRRKPYAGVVFSLYFITYNIGRFTIESIREDSSFIFGHLRIAQLMAVAQIIAGVILLIYHLRRRKSGTMEPQTEAQA